MKIIKSALAFLITVMASFVFAVSAFAVFNENLDSQQVKEDIVSCREQAKEKYEYDKSLSAFESERQKPAQAQKQIKPKIRKLSVPVDEIGGRKKDIVLGLISIIAAGVIFIILIILKRKEKTKGSV